ncbi:MAG: glycosyltransferase [Patescibacteria group bacterium]
MNQRIKLSIIIPVYNEAESVAELHTELVDVLTALNHPYEIIFVDDGSTDDTFNRLKSLPNTKIVRFRKNFGQTAALDAGIKHAQGDYLITLDGDGQNDPRDIPKLINGLEKNNLDVISGWRKMRHDPWLKKLSSRAANLVRQFLISDDIHDSGCTLKIYRHECFEHVDLAGEMHRFIPALLKIKGFKIGEMVVNHRPRLKGKTKYNWTRGIKGILDIFSVWFWKKFAARPLHLFGGVGILILLISTLAGLVATYQRMFMGLDLSDTALTNLALFGFLAGIQFFVFGLLADIVSKSYFSVTRDTMYEIKEIADSAHENKPSITPQKNPTGPGPR